MNERIQELAYQAEDYADSIVDQGGEFHVTYTKKFAELIVQECVAMIKGYEFALGRKGELSKTMREYFGVEE